MGHEAGTRALLTRRTYAPASETPTCVAPKDRKRSDGLASARPRLRRLAANSPGLARSVSMRRLRSGRNGRAPRLGSIAYRRASCGTESESARLDEWKD